MNAHARAHPANTHHRRLHAATVTATGSVHTAAQQQKLCAAAQPLYGPLWQCDPSNSRSSATDRHYTQPQSTSTTTLADMVSANLGGSSKVPSASPHPPAAASHLLLYPIAAAATTARAVLKKPKPQSLLRPHAKAWCKKGTHTCTCTCMGGSAAAEGWRGQTAVARMHPYTCYGQGHLHQIGRKGRRCDLLV